MKICLSILLLAGISVAEGSEPTHFDSYGDAYRAAQKTGRPLLVILNPEANSVAKVDPITIEAVRKSKRRRTLLKDYVVAVIDTGSNNGNRTLRLFKSPELPRVVVIDKRQQVQLFQTSEKLYGQLWTKILQTYRSGERPAKKVKQASSSRATTARYRTAYRSHAFCST